MPGVWRAAGRTGRGTAVDPAGASVNGRRTVGGRGGAGVTRTPWPGAFTGAGDDAGPEARARWTGAEAVVATFGLMAADRVRACPAGAVCHERARPEGTARSAGAEDDPVVVGIVRSGATGSRCAVGSPGGVANGRRSAERSSPATGRADSAGASRSRLPPTAGFRTAGDGAPVNDGFCHVGSRAPNPASATPGRPPPVARRIGGSPGHAATGAGADGGTAAALGVLAVPPPETEPPSGAASRKATAPPEAASPEPAPLSSPPEPPRRPRSRSRNPTVQPSAVPRVTKDAIWSV